MSPDVDFLMVGAGACGLAAAIAAHDAGISAAPVEKLSRAGGNSALSTGPVPPPAAASQREAGIAGDPDKHVCGIMAIAADTEGPVLGRRLAEVSAASLEWPFYGCRVVPGLFHTQGGLRVDRDARVPRRDGGAVPNPVAGAPPLPESAAARALGYASGNGLLSGLKAAP